MIEARYREFLRMLPYPFEGGYTDLLALDIDEDTIRPVGYPFQLPKSLNRTTWNLEPEGFQMSLAGMHQTVNNLQIQVAQVVVEQHTNQPLVHVHMTVFASKQQGTLTPDRRWVNTTTAREADFWQLPMEADAIPAFALEVHDAIQLCLLDRYRGLAGVAQRCDACPHQLTCVGLNW